MGTRRKRRYMMRNPRLLTVAQAADIVGMSEGAIRWNLREGYLRGYYDGFRWHIDPDNLDRWRQEYYED